VLAVAPAFAEEPLVVVAVARTGHIETFDAALQHMATVEVGQQVESVSASPDGHRLYIAQEDSKASGTCCSLFSLDLQTKRMCLLTAPAMFGAPSPDGRFLFTQGKKGVDVFDASTLSPLPTMKAAGQFNLQPSPDGRWLYGIANSAKPSLTIFDMESRSSVRRLSIPAGPATGAWSGDRFYVFSYSFDAVPDGIPNKGRLWTVRPEAPAIGQAIPIDLLDFHGACNQPVLLMLAGSADRLFLAEAFGFKVDRRLACPDAAIGGVYVIHPFTGRARRIAPTVQVKRMAVSPDGRDLYVIQSSGPSPLSNVRLLHIDTMTGRVVQSIALDSGDWNLTLARIPSALIARGQYWHAAESCSR
jgi:hypothetical protein